MNTQHRTESGLEAAAKPVSRAIALGVHGMSCAGCVGRVEKALHALPGVEQASVNLALERAEVHIDSSVSAQQVADAIEQAGFSATLEREVAPIEMSLNVSGMSCAGCVGRVEKALDAIPGVQQASVNLALERAQVRIDPSLDPATVLDAVTAAGYAATLVVPLAAPDNGNENTPGTVDAAATSPPTHGGLSPEARWLMVAVALSTPLLLQMVSMSLTLGWHLSPLVELALATPVQFLAGARFYRGAWSSLKHGSANMDVLVAMGTSAAYFYSLSVVFGLISGHLYFEASAVIITLVLLGKWLEARARRGASAALRQLMSLRPETAQVIRDGREQNIKVEAVRIGDHVRVRPGERIAVDGFIVDGDTEVDESLITGESLPVDKHPGDKVIGGAVNGSGAIELQCTALATQGRLAQIVALVEDAQMRKAPVQQLVDRVSAIFVPVVLVLAAITFAGWWMQGAGFESALLAGVAVLVIACPCALGLATPTALVAGTGAAARAGILIRDIEALERAASIDTVMFDKTGTLTRGKPRVVQFSGADEPQTLQVLALAAAVQRASEHPLAHALVNWADEQHATSHAVSDFRNRAGFGVSGQVDGHKVAVGTLALMDSLGVSTAHVTALSAQLQHPHASIGWIAIDGKVEAMAAFADEVREQSAAAVQTLHAQGTDTILLSGDHDEAARHIAQSLGIKQWHARMTPQDKAEHIEQLRAQGHRVAMVGDGVNDAPALAVADLGIAMGEGTDVAMETAGVTLMRSDPQLVPAALRVSRATVRTIRQNLFWAFIYNVIGIPLAAFGLLNPTLAGAAMAMSSVCVVSNSLRLRRWSARSQ